MDATPRKLVSDSTASYVDCPKSMADKCLQDLQAVVFANESLDPWLNLGQSKRRNAVLARPFLRPDPSSGRRVCGARRSGAAGRLAFLLFPAHRRRRLVTLSLELREEGDQMSSLESHAAAEWDLDIRQTLAHPAV
jgi:hypothetical protein